VPLIPRPVVVIAVILLLSAGCAHRIEPPLTSLPAPPPRLAQPAPASNLVVNGSFEETSGDDPAGWKIVGRGHAQGTLRAAAIPGAPDGRRVAEITRAPVPSGEPDYGMLLVQDVRVKPWTTYDLSVWVRGIDLVSALEAPRGFGQQCGLFFWLLGPDNDPSSRLFPSGAFPRKDGTTPWELRKMRFTTPPPEAFPPPAKGNDGRFHLSLNVVLIGTGTVQVDDIRLAPSTAAPPPPRRGPGRLALARHGKKPYFGFGIHVLPTGMTWKDLGKEEIFNFSTGGGTYQEKAALGILSSAGSWTLDPACRGCGKPESADCVYCRACPHDDGACKGYDPSYIYPPGVFGSWVDEPNFNPQIQGDLEDLARAARRIKKTAARLLAPGQGFYLYDSDMPGGTYFNTYGWDDLALYHASEAFDIVGSIRRGGNPKPGAVGGAMSEFQETSINGIRESTRRVAGDVTDPGGRQGKPVWMIVNGGSGKIITDRKDPDYPFAPRDTAELRASRPDLPQLRYMLLAAILNGATGLLFYQDAVDTLLTPQDPYWKEVMIPAAAELATLERDTGFLTEAEINPIGYRIERMGGAAAIEEGKDGTTHGADRKGTKDPTVGTASSANGKGPAVQADADAVDSMLKRRGDDWILAVANSSPHPASGLWLVLEGGRKLAAPPERLVYRHDQRPSRRHFEAVGAPSGGDDRFPLDLSGYGVALYRFRLAR
jgi:hypothetical protein